MPLALSPNPPTLQATVAHLTRLATHDLPSSIESFDTDPCDAVGEAAALTDRYPHSSAAWIVRGRCEMRACLYPDAARSFQKAKRPDLSAAAERCRQVAASLAKWGELDRLHEEGQGYWLALCTESRDTGRRLIERHPDGRTVMLIELPQDGANYTRGSFGFRKLSAGRPASLIVESDSWLSNGGICVLAILEGGRGHWRTGAMKKDVLWDVPVVDFDHDGKYEFAVREWVWYKGPTWARIFRYRNRRLVDVTRQYPVFVRRQARDLRRELSELGHTKRDAENRAEAKALLRRYGYRR